MISEKSLTQSRRKQHCILVVDANILIQDFWFEGSSWSYLKKRNFLGHMLVVPEIALDEATAHIERRADELLNRIAESGFTPRLEAQYQKLFQRKRRTKETAAALAQRYKRFVVRTLQSNKGFVDLPPSVDLAHLLKRSITRTKPFNKGDKGFRDTLIWLGVVELVRKFHRVSFISANTTDYADGVRLHDDLEADLKPVLPENFHFRYFASLPEFIAFMDRDGRAGAEALQTALMTTGYGDFSLDAWVRENIQDLVASEEYDGVSWTALPYWAENPRLIEVTDLVGLEVHSARSIPGDRVEFFCDVALVGVFQCSILYSTWEGVVHPIQVEWVDEVSDDMWTEIGIRSVGTFLLRLVFDLDRCTVIHHDVVAVQHKVQEAKSVFQEIQEEFGDLPK